MRQDRTDPDGLLVADTEIGSRLRAARIRHGVSLRALSRDLAVSPGTMSQVETGKTRLSVVRLHQIATALGMTPDEVLAVPANGANDGAAGDGGNSKVGAGPVVTDWRIYGPLNFDPVLEAALAVFMRTGYHGATVRDVARECGRSVSGIYHHYPSKQEMLRKILDLGVTELLIGPGWHARRAVTRSSGSVLWSSRSSCSTPTGRKWDSSGRARCAAWIPPPGATWPGACSSNG